MQRDRDIIQRICRQDQSALAELYQHYGGPVYSLARQMLRNAQHAEEITQDVFLRVWHQADKWDAERGTLLTWMLTITRYAAIDRIRKEKRRPTISEIPLEKWTGYIPKVDDKQWQTRHTLQEMLDKLPDEQAQVIRLAYFEGQTHTDMAEILDLPLGTVKTRVRLGLQKLRQLWEDSSEN